MGWIVDKVPDREEKHTNRIAVKYSDVRKLIRLDIQKKTGNDVASFTHFLQQNESHSAYFERGAVEYVERLIREERIASDVNLQSMIPFHWDVPFPPINNPEFSFIDLFAGIGGIRMAFQDVGGECVFSSEWDSYARKTYEKNFGEVPFGDITEIAAIDIPDHDVLLGGFPCQPFSIAGVSKKNSLGRSHGFLDQTQGTLFFDIARIIDEKRPRAFMLENVKNLVAHDKKRTFKVIESTLKAMGYSLHHRVLDARYYVPQHRERIIIVGFREDQQHASARFEFPSPQDKQPSIRSILESEVLQKYTLSDKLWSYLQDYKKKHQAKGNGFGYGLVDLDGVSRTLSARYYKDGSEILIDQDGINPRRLTPRECARLQGFPDEFVIPVSDNQAYKQFGNSVAVPLIRAVAESIKSALISRV
jgi:DNA (cytosine-5)-methyltransferase 1